MRYRLQALLAIAAVVLAAQLAVAAPPATENANSGKLIDAYFDSDGVRIHYVEQGRGEPVLLIHGFTASAAMNWQAPGIFKGLAEDYRVIALDNRGHGKSDKPHDEAAYGTHMVADAIRLLDHLEIDRAHVVGYSMGGFITSKLVATHPDRLLSATLGGAGWMRKDDPQVSLLDELAQSLEDGHGITPLIRRLNPPGEPQPTDQEIQSMNQLIMLMNDAEALASVARGMRQLHVDAAQLRANKVPTLALIGSIDPLKESVDPLQGVMANLDVVVIDGADHLTALQQPEFTEALKAHLAANSLP